MKISTPVLIKEDDNEHQLSAEVDSDVISFELDGKLLFRMDFEGNFDEFVIAIMKVWAGWSTNPVHSTSKKEGEQ